MLIHELTADECAAILQRATLGRLACARHDQPYVVPVHFSFDRDRGCLFGFAPVGQKVIWMRENPRVCVEVDEITDKDRWQSVVIFGRYEEIGDDAVDDDGRRRAEELFRQRSEWWLPAAGKVAGRERHGGVVVYRIQIDHITGRRAGPAATPVTE